MLSSELAEIAAGWWVYEDPSQPDAPRPVFVTTKRWQQIRESTTSAQNDPLDL